MTFILQLAFMMFASELHVAKVCPCKAGSPHGPKGSWSDACCPIKAPPPPPDPPSDPNTCTPTPPTCTGQWCTSCTTPPVKDDLQLTGCMEILEEDRQVVVCQDDSGAIDITWCEVDECLPEETLSLCEYYAPHFGGSCSLSCDGSEIRCHNSWIGIIPVSSCNTLSPAGVVSEWETIPGHVCP